MDAERFERLIEAYGGAPARWPDAERADALAYRDGSPEAASLCAAALALDEALDAWVLEPAGAALRERITQTGARRRLAWPLVREARVWWAGAGLAAACAMGMVVGANLADLSAAQAQAGEVASGVLTASDNLTVFGSTVDLGKTS